MIAAGKPTIETLSSPPPEPPGPGVLTVAALVLFAIVTFISWALTANPKSEVGAFPAASLAAPQQQTAPAQGKSSAGSSAASQNRPAAYEEFCENSATLCSPLATAPLNRYYLQFCWNSPTLCTIRKSE